MIEHRERFIGLDVLRGVAMLLVFISHSTREILVQHSNSILVSIHSWVTTLNVGRIGLVAFFCICGFLAPISFERATTAKQILKDFFLKKFFRLYPIYLLSIVGVCLLFSSDRWNAGALLANLTMLPTIFSQARLQDIYWSLEVTVLFHVLFSLIFLISSILQDKRRYCVPLSSVACFVIFICNIGTLKQIDIGWGYFYCVSLTLAFSSFSIGYRSHDRNYLYYIPLMLVLVVPSMDLYRYVIKEPIYVVNKCGPQFLGVGLFFIFLRLNEVKSKALRLMGEISYPSFCFHMLIIVATQKFFFLFGFGVSEWALIFYVISAFANTLIFSYFMHRYVEEPIAKLRNALDRRI